MAAGGAALAGAALSATAATHPTSAGMVWVCMANSSHRAESTHRRHRCDAEWPVQRDRTVLADGDLIGCQRWNDTAQGTGESGRVRAVDRDGAGGHLGR